ncbi:MAG: hypothetical protein PVG90_04185, partial [Bacillota bacterium]
MITKAIIVTDSIHNTSQLRQTHYKYDAKTGNLLQVSEVYNGGYLQTYFTYDNYGNMKTKTDANGNKLCYNYSEKFKGAYLTEITNAAGATIAKYDYDFDTGNKTMVTDAKGTVTNYEYDAIDRLTMGYLNSSNSKIGYRRQYTYDDVNNTVTLKYGNETAGWQETLITYDSFFGKPTLVQRKNNGNWVTQQTKEYDSNGRLAWKKDGLGHQTTYSYDELDRVTLIKQPNGSTIQYIYNDRIKTITDANGNIKKEKYDVLGRLYYVYEYPTSGAKYQTAYSYDSYFNDSGDKPIYNLVMVVNDNDAITNYSYDNLGRLIKTEYPQDDRNPMSAENFTYDSVGNLKTKTNGKGTKTLEYEFFSGYRLKKVTEPGGKTVSYTYDANDNPLTQTTSGVTYTYTYDARNRVTNLKAQLDGYTFNVGYDYDTFGRVTRITYPGRNAAVNYNYNELDLLQSIPGFVESCKYDADNKLTAMALKNGISTTYAYDDNDRPINIVAGSLLNLVYSYDPVGNITQINNDYYGYDGLNRLIWYGNMPYTHKAGATGIFWSYDGAGNVTTKENYLKGTIQGSIFEYDKANRLLSMGMTIFTNDNTGSRTEKMQGTN